VKNLITSIISAAFITVTTNVAAVQTEVVSLACQNYGGVGLLVNEATTSENIPQPEPGSNCAQVIADLMSIGFEIRNMSERSEVFLFVRELR